MGDTTTLKGSAGRVGALELNVNGERFDDVQELEFACDGEGRYSVFMSGMGATIAYPPPGQGQHELCQQLVELARAFQVPVRCRDEVNLAPNWQMGGYTEGYGQGAFFPWQYGAGDFMHFGGAGTEAAGTVWNPPFGNEHCFHSEVSIMGTVKDNFRQFTKVGYEGRLSVVSEAQVRTGGIHKFCVQFTSGELSKADGVGFIFSSKLPCKKNIQRIVSIFVNQRGRICMRVYQDIIRASAHVKPLKLGDWVEMSMDLDKHIPYFTIWPGNSQAQLSRSSYAEFAFGSKISDSYTEAGNSQQLALGTGHLACVVKNEGVTVTLGS